MYYSKTTLWGVSLVFFATILTPTALFAASIEVVPQAVAVAVGQTVRLDIVLDTKGEQLNAFQGELTLDPGISEIRIEDGQSIVGVWVDRPHQEPNTLTITFSGIVPNGFNGVGVLFSLFVSTRGEGDITISPKNISILRNDGEGSAVTATVKPGTFAAVQKLSITLPEVTKDSNKPLPFTPIIAQSNDLFNGEYFLMFDTLDSGSGIDHFELLESPRELSARSLENSNHGWSVVHNPTKLSDQNLESFIYVKAIDRSGNTQIALLLPKSGSQQVPLHNYTALGILVLLGLAGALWFFFQRKNIHTNESTPS